MVAVNQSSSSGSGSYFELLGLPEVFDLDLKALDAAYLARSKLVHPDRFAQAPADERVVALQQSMDLNQAYKALKKPTTRAEYLLERKGVTIGDQERLDDTEFLTEILRLREELGEARAANQVDLVGRLEVAMKQRNRALIAKLSPRFAEVEGEGDAAAALAAIKQTLIELRYVSRYLEECAAMLDAAED